MTDLKTAILTSIKSAGPITTADLLRELGVQWRLKILLYEPTEIAVRQMLNTLSNSGKIILADGGWRHVVAKPITQGSLFQ